MIKHIYLNSFIQCHPGNPLCIPAIGLCKVYDKPWHSFLHTTKENKENENDFF